MKLINTQETKRWSPGGHDAVVSQEVCGVDLGATKAVVHISTIKPGGGSDVDRHPASEQVFVILSGELTFRDDQGNELVAGPGRAVFVPVNDPHGTHNKGVEDAVCLVVTAPPAE